MHLWACESPVLHSECTRCPHVRVHDIVTSRVSSSCIVFNSLRYFDSNTAVGIEYRILAAILVVISYHSSLVILSNIIFFHITHKRITVQVHGVFVCSRNEFGYLAETADAPLTAICSALPDKCTVGLAYPLNHCVFTNTCIAVFQHRMTSSSYTWMPQTLKEGHFYLYFMKDKIDQFHSSWNVAATRVPQSQLNLALSLKNVI